MTRVALKFWMAPKAVLEASLLEGEIAIGQEDGVFYKRPDGQPTAPLIGVGNIPRATANSPGAVQPGPGILINQQGVISVDPTYVGAAAGDEAISMAIALG